MNSGLADVVIEVTDEFVQAYGEDVPLWPHVAAFACGQLPEWVNRRDPRVLAIVERCRAAVAGSCLAHVWRFAETRPNRYAFACATCGERRTTTVLEGGR